MIPTKAATIYLQASESRAKRPTQSIFCGEVMIRFYHNNFPRSQRLPTGTETKRQEKHNEKVNLCNSPFSLQQEDFRLISFRTSKARQYWQKSSSAKIFFLSSCSFSGLQRFQNFPGFGAAEFGRFTQVFQRKLTVFADSAPIGIAFIQGVVR